MPTYAMRKPPIAGPATVAISKALVFQVIALLNAAVGTSSGVMLERAGQIVRLIEAALQGAKRMQRYGNDCVGAGQEIAARVLQQRGQGPGERAPPSADDMTIHDYDVRHEDIILGIEVLEDFRVKRGAVIFVGDKVFVVIG